MLRNSIGVIIVLMAFFGSPLAHALSEVGIDLIPVGIASGDYPNAYTGFGYGAHFDYVPSTENWGGVFHITTQGNGSLLSLGALYYLSGHPLTPGLDPTRQDDVLQVRSKARSLNIQVSPAFFSASHTVNTSTLIGAQETDTGVGMLITIEMKQPIFGSDVLGLSANYFNSLSFSLSSIFFGLSFGLPLGL